MFQQTMYVNLFHVFEKHKERIWAILKWFLVTELCLFVRLQEWATYVLAL